MKTYTVNVGNIGNVDCDSRKDAEKTYREYCQQSRTGYGRAGGETVTLLVNGDPVKDFTPRPRKGSMQARIAEILADYDPETRFDVIAYELTHDGQGWSVNTPWKIASDCTASEAGDHARNRFDVFRANYSSRATIASIEDTGDGDTVYLDCAGLPFLEIRPVTED